ncbi:glycosyltransferase family 4 protein [Flavobacteriaceae bacterium]|nr:glycosyltransferase family 4 protein [Flavobacteriaceae bacterium]
MKKLLIIGFVWPEPKSSAAGVRMMQLIDFFLSEGYQITFASSSLKGDKSLNLASKGIQERRIELNNSSFDLFISKLNPTVALFDRFMMEEQFGWRVAQQCPNALKILDTEDLHCLRKAREEAFKDTALLNRDYLFGKIAKREIASIYRSDLSLIISEAEMVLLKTSFEVPEALLCYLPLLIKNLTPNDISNLPSFTERKHLITIGNFLHAPNLDSVIYLKNNIWPKLGAKLKNVELHVFGAYANDRAKQLESKDNNFFIQGFTPDVDKVMQNAKICLAPLRFGAGLKGKFFDAMKNGTPFITTSIGAEGILDLKQTYNFVTDDISGMIDYVVQLYNSEELWVSQQSLGFNILSKKFNKSIHLAKLSDKLNQIIASMHEHRLSNFTGLMLQHHAMQSTMYMSRWIEEKNK